MRRKMIRTICVLAVCMMAFTLMPMTANAKVKTEGKYNPKKGHILVTKDGKIGHAAMIYYVDPKNKKKGTTIEAVGPGMGVRTQKLQNWGNKREYWILEVKGLSRKQQEKAADWSLKQVRKPYNSNFSNISTRKSFYCSQLVWAAYKDLYKIDMNTNSYDGFKYYYDTGKLRICSSKKYCKQIAPMELVWSNKTKVVYHYKK